jgi:hypothetical protein
VPGLRIQDQKWGSGLAKALVGIPLEEQRKKKKKKKKKKIMMMMTITIPSPRALSIGVDRGNPLKACSVSFINCIPGTNQFYLVVKARREGH